MKGFIFNELFEMVGKTFSPEMVEEIIEASHLPNQGAYSDVGIYDHEELIQIFSKIAQVTSVCSSSFQ